MFKVKISKIVSCLLAICMVFMTVSFTALADAPTFSDMPNDWSTNALNKAVENGLLNGYNGMIMPNDSVTRAQMAAIMVRAFGATQKADISSFVDVSDDAWYRDDMAKSVAMGIFKGDGANLNPDNNITREEAFTVLARAFELSDGDVSVLDSFKDKDKVSDWAIATVAAIVSNSYAKGADGYLNPNKNITRAEFSVLMDNIVKVYITEPGEYSDFGEGNVMVRANGVKIKKDIKGDLIVGSSVEKNGISLVNCSVSGRLVNDKNADKVTNVSGGSIGGGSVGGGSGSNGNNGSSDGGSDSAGDIGDVGDGIEDGGEI